MDNISVKDQLKKALLLTTGLFIVGKKKLAELVHELEQNGLNKEDAEKTAHEMIASAKQHKDDFVKKLTSEIEKRNIFATKDDVAKLQDTLKEISDKLDE